MPAEPIRFSFPDLAASRGPTGGTRGDGESRTSSIALMTTPKRPSDPDSELGTIPTPSPRGPKLEPQYKSAKSPYDGVDMGVDYFDGALREGPVPNAFAPDYIGLLFQYAAIGLIDGVLPSTIYPLLQMYFNTSGRITLTATALVQLPWSFKMFYGMLSDCLPIYGYRRRPYMVLGWTIAFIMLVVMGLTPQGRPYFTVPAYRYLPSEEYTPEIVATFNEAATTAGTKYVLLMMFCAFGYLMADVAADGIVVELAQREPLAIRGRLQTTIYSVRTLFNIFALVINAFAFNGEDYGGAFSFSLSFPTLMLILAVLLSPVIPMSWFYIYEEQAPRQDFGMYIAVLWEAIQQRVVYRVIAYSFLHGVTWHFSFTALFPMQAYWAKVTPLNEKISAFIGQTVYLLAIWLTGRYGLHWNWRTVPLVTAITIVALDSVCSLCTVWDVVRSQWFFLGIPITTQLPYGMSYIISTFVCIELAIEGHEAAMYGMLTTVSNFATPLASSLTNIVNSAWDLSTERIKADSTAVRWDVTTTILIMYAVNLSSVLFLFLHPRQKEETQMLKRYGGSSFVMGCVTVAYLSVTFVWSVTTNFLAIFPSTSCLIIAGGKGC